MWTSADENSLRALLQRGCQDGSPVITLDQFEEFLIRFGISPRNAPNSCAKWLRSSPTNQWTRA